MKYDSLLFSWFIDEFKDQPMKVRSIEALLKEGHTGLAESAVVRSLKAKYHKETDGKIKVTGYGQTSYI